MNKCILVGRLTQDPQTSNLTNGNVVTRFGIAVSRTYKNQDGNYDADFPNCVAFGRTAEFISKYFAKGNRIGVTGRIQTGRYTNKDGATVYTTDVVVDEAEFVEGRGGNTESTQTANTSQNNNATKDTFQNIPADIDEELPFS